MLHSFNGSDGAQPENSVAKDGKGNLIGTTFVGGTYNVGTVYKITSQGAFSTFYNFCDCLDAQYPQSDVKLTVDKAGDIYGTSSGGGSTGMGNGAVFEFSPTGTESILYNFTFGNDGANPASSPVLEKKTGNLYGVTAYGGQNGDGDLYKLAPDGTLTVLYSFGTGNDGQYPSEELLEDKQHNLYGTTFLGGTSGYGTVYKFAPNGTETILHNFAGGSDGEYPSCALIEDASGNLYGTTNANSGASGNGTVFKIATDGTFTTLYAFQGGQDGVAPWSLAMDKMGNLYGTTYHGGAYSKGTIFELTAGGTETVLHSFGSVANDGAYPVEGPTIVGNILYGTTPYGGAEGDGTVFKLKI